MKLFRLFAICIALLPIASFSSSAITVGSGWVLSADMFVPPTRPFEFTLLTSAYLQITDTVRAGDRYEVNNFGHLLGLTSEPSPPAPYQFDPDLAYADSKFSKGQWLLGPGAYSITATVLPATFTVDAGFYGIRLVVAPVPEQTTYSLMIAGMMLLALFRRNPGHRLGC